MYSNNTHAQILADLPPQMVSLTKKNKEWKEKCMDALEAVGRTQYLENIKLIENYEMVKGRFIYSHYFENEGYTDFLAQLTKEFELPSYLKHYDIISQVINTLSGEALARPDIYRIKNHSEQATNEFERSKTDLLLKYVMSQIQMEISAKLLEAGLDENKEDFESEEEAQQYQQLIEDAKKAMSPVEIQKYMETSWTQAAELWAQNQLSVDKSRFSLKEKEKREFEDMLVADRCFRHFYITPTGYNQETWNPVQVFFQKSPDVEYIEDGDYVGRCYYLSIPAIIDRFGYLMTNAEILSLEEGLNQQQSKGTKWNYTKGSEYVFNEYMVPFEGYQVWDTLNKTIPNFDGQMMNDLTSGKFFNDRRGLYRVTEGYWKTQRKIGKVTYIDPETGMLTKKLVDENFIVPDHFTVINESFADSEDVDTVVWTWVNEVWKGIKINTKGHLSDTDLYLNIGPADFQFKGDLNPYDAKLPVCGQVFSPRNSESMSLVDLMKPYQIFYNVAMNQLYQIMEREIGRWVIHDINLFPDGKDWGGDRAMEKFMLVAKQLNAVPADTSPANTRGASSAGTGHFPREFNWDDSPRMQSRLMLAQAFEQMALRQIGFNDYRLGKYGSEATAGGVARGQESSQAQTESYFTNFSNYLRRCYTMDLNIAQFTQATNRDVGVMNIKSDLSRTYIKTIGTDILLADLQVYVMNSQEFIRQTESIRRLAIENNTTGADLLDLSEILTSESPAEIKIKLKETRKRLEELQKQDQQLKQQQLADQKELEMLRIQKEDERLDKTLQNKLDVAYVNEGSKIINNSDGSQTEDLSKQRQLDLQEQQSTSTQDIASKKLELQRQKDISERDYKLKQLAVQQAKIEKDLQIQRDKLRIVETLKGKTSN